MAEPGAQRGPIAPVSAAEPPRDTVPESSGALGSCPACGGPLYGWVEAFPADARRSDTYILDRCEECGLGAVREAVLDDEALLGGVETKDGRLLLTAANRRSLQAALGEGRWAALDLPSTPFVLTSAALRKVLERRGYAIRRLRFPLAGANQRWMWQTLMNAITLHPNFAREALARRLTPATARSPWAFALDAVVSVVAAPLVALVSIPVEAAAALAHRGGLMRVEATVTRREGN